MKIVIDKDKELQKLKDMLSNLTDKKDVQSVKFAINVIEGIDGTPLPEHHGDLIDRQRLQREMEKDKRRALSFVDLTDFVWLAPTIIEGSESE